MSSMFGKIFKVQSTESPATSGTDQPGMFPADDAFALVTEDRLDEAREIVRDMSPRDRALLSFTLEELTRLVSEEEDFRRMKDRRAAREARQAGDTE